MPRKAYGFAAGLAVATLALAWLASYHYNLPLRDPDGFAGPSYVRLPAIVFLFYLADVVPRSLVANRGFAHFGSSVKAYTKERWTKSRVGLVVVGLTTFYVVYVSYRNLKSFLPFVRHGVYDNLLGKLDKALLFGHYPAAVLHDILGTGISAYVLAYVYVAFLIFVPLSLGAALVWSKNVATGFWYVVALCVNWILGAASYYWLPSLGPAFSGEGNLFVDLPNTAVTQLQQSLQIGRSEYTIDPRAIDSVPAIAAFASLHVSVIFTAALICHYVIPNRIVRYTMWIYFVLTSISTVYFGWHYLLDDAAGLAIGYISVWVGAKVTGHEMRPIRERSSGDGVIGVFPPESSRATTSQVLARAGAVETVAGSPDEAGVETTPSPALAQAADSAAALTPSAGAERTDQPARAVSPAAPRQRRHQRQPRPVADGSHGTLSRDREVAGTDHGTTL